MNTVADDTLYRIKQDVRTRYEMKSYSTEDDNTKRQMLDDLNFLIDEIDLYEKGFNKEADRIDKEHTQTIMKLEETIFENKETIERLVKYLNKHIVSIPEWVEEIADEYGIELE